MNQNPDILVNSSIQRQAAAIIPTDWGNFNMIAFADSSKEQMPHLAMVHETTDFSKPVLVRIHSECMTGDLFHSNRCDCGEQLDKAMEMVAKEGGVVIYLRQEGRGIGLINKLKAYNLQDEGLNTVDANLHLGFEVDERQFGIGAEIIQVLGIKKIYLLTNNPDKIEAIENSPIEILGRVPISIKPKNENKGYLKTKQEIMGHLLG